MVLDLYLCLVTYANNYRADVESAIALSSLPRFPLLDVIQIDPNSGFMFQTSQPYLKHPGELDEWLIYIFVNLRHLSRLLEIESDSDLSQPSSSDAIYLVERRLIYILNATEVWISRVARSCCLSALIFAECFLRRVSPNSRSIRTLLVKLETSTSKHATHDQGNEGLNESSRFLLWSMFVGAVTATSDKRGRFIGQLVSNDLMKHSWEEVKQILRQIAFPETVAENAARRVCEEAQEVLCIRQTSAGAI
jgi:hypothetical protein